MKQQTVISLTLIAAALVVSVAFQNCSNVKFATSSASTKSEDGGLIQIDTPNSQALPDAVDPDQPTPASTPSLPKDAEVERAYANCDGLSTTAPDFSSFGSGTVFLQAVNGNRVVDSANEVRVVNFNGSLEIKKSKSAELTNVRGSAFVTAREARIIDVRSNSATDRLLIDTGRLVSIVNTRTPLCIRSAAFDSLVDLRTEEPLILIGRTVNGVKPRINKLVNIRGTLIVRGIDIDDIVDFRGSKLVLENSVVGRMTNVRTDLYLKNSLIGNEVDVQGQRANF